MPRPKNRKRKEQARAAAAAKWAKRDALKESVDSTDTEVEETMASPKSASRKKIAMMNAAANIDEVQDQNWILLHVSQLTRLICDTSCPDCEVTGLSVNVCEGENAGFAAKLVLRCDLCGYEKFQYSSPRIGDSDKKNVAFEVNRRMTMFSHEMGGSHNVLQTFSTVMGIPGSHNVLQTFSTVMGIPGSHNVLQTFSTVMGIPGMHLKTFQGHDKKVSAAEILSGTALAERTAATIREAYAETDEDLREALNEGEVPVINISVSYDGTWQKRGFTSLFGVGVCIDILTGLVVDTCVLSKYCHACKLAEARGLPEDELAAWKQQHAPDCCQNFSKSSKAMEAEAAKIMWSRSVQQFSFRYMEMLSDGDSSAYRAVVNSNPYPDQPQVIQKLDCVNHAHKRMGTALRKLSKEERLGGRGVGRLTENKCDSLQNFYRGAILDNIPSVTNMRNAIWASLWHSMSTDEEPRHHQCPTGPQSRCFYQRALALGEELPSHRDHPSSTFLTTSIAHRLIPVYRRMADEALLQRLVHGGTQNNNECLNGMIWSRCPKTSFMGLDRVRGSVARAVSIFNEGANAMISVMNRLHVDITTTTLNFLARKDDRRMRAADAAEARRRRKEYAAQRRLNVREEAARDGNVYEPGGH